MNSSDSEGSEVERLLGAPRRGVRSTTMERRGHCCVSFVFVIVLLTTLSLIRVWSVFIGHPHSLFPWWWVVCDQELTNAAESMSPVLSSISLLPLNSYRLVSLFRRLEFGEAITLRTIGGSNSVGHGLSSKDSLVYQRIVPWLSRRWPPSNGSHTFINHARPATTSSLASWCLDELVPALNDTDLLFVEYAANDPNSDNPGAEVENWVSGTAPAMGVEGNMERITRRVLLTTTHTAVFYVHFTRDAGGQLINAEEEHEHVAQRYSVPSVSLRRLLQNMRDSPEWQILLGPATQFVSNWNGPATQQTIMRDPAHASDFGHFLVNELIQLKLLDLHRIHYIDRQQSGVVASLPLPSPLIESHDYAFTCRFLPMSPITVEQAITSLEVEDMWGWQVLSILPDKHVLQPNPAKCNPMVSNAGACWLTLRLPLKAHQPVAVWVFFTRSHEARFGDCWAWLYCSTEPRFHSTPTLLNARWNTSSTQTAMDSVWPAALLRSAANASPALSSALGPGHEQMAREELRCRLDRLGLWHLRGDFYLTGYMVS